MLDVKTRLNPRLAQQIDFLELVRLSQIASISSAHSLKYRTYLRSNLAHRGIAKIEEEVARRKGLPLVVEYEVTCTLLTLFGPGGALPSHYTDYAIQSAKEGDTTLIEFTEIFYQRLMQMLSFIVRRSDVNVNLLRHVLERGKTPSVVKRIWSFMGIPAKRGASHPFSMLRSCGAVLLSRPACMLQSMVSAFFGLPVSVKQFLLIKAPLRRDQYSKLGTQNSLLGASFYAGTDAYLYQNKISIRLEETSVNTYRSVMRKVTDGSLYLLLDHYLGKRISYEIEADVCLRDRKSVLHSYHPLTLGLDLWCTSSLAAL